MAILPKSLYNPQDVQSATAFENKIIQRVAQLLGQSQFNTAPGAYDSNLNSLRNSIGSILSWMQDDPNGNLDLMRARGSRFPDLVERAIGEIQSGTINKELAKGGAPELPKYLTEFKKNIPSGVLLRDTSDGRVYFIDNGKKRLITTPAAFTPRSGFVDVDSSLLANLPKGADITSKPLFNFKSKAETETLLKQAGFSVTQSGVSKEAVQQQQPKSKQEQERDFIEPKQAQKKDFTDYSKLPDRIKNDPFFKKMSEEQRALYAFQYNIAQFDSAEEYIKGQKALKEAAKLAEPNFKQDLLLAQDEFERSLSKLLSENDDQRKLIETKLDIAKQDLIKNFERLTESQREEKLRDIESTAIIKEQALREASSRDAQVAADISRIQRRITAIDEDLKYGKEQLSLEEQASLARSMREYQRNLQSAQEQAVNAGLGFSSIRIEAERRLAEDLADVTESTRRQKMRERRALETESGRDTTELVMGQQEIERKNQEFRVGLAREMELKIGYDALPPDIKKYLPQPIKIDSTGAAVRSEAERRQVEREMELKRQQQDIDIARKRAEEETARQKKILEREREQGVEVLERAREQTIGSEGRAGELGGITGTLERKKTKEALGIAEALEPSIFVSEKETEEELKRRGQL